VKTKIAETKIQKSIYSENGDPARSWRWRWARLVCGVAPRAECVFWKPELLPEFLKSEFA